MEADIAGSPDQNDQENERDNLVPHLTRFEPLRHSEFFAKKRISTVFHCISTVFQYFRRTFNLKS